MTRHNNLSCKVYIGDLARDVNEKDIEKAFNYYGPLRSVWVARNPPGFAFVEFEDDRDADDAIKGLDGTSIGGSRVRVEHSTGRVRPKPYPRRGGGGGGGHRGGGGRRGFDSNDKCYECGERGHYAYDCRHRGGGGRRRSSRSRSRSRDRYRRHSSDRSRSHSRSRRDSRSKSRD